MQKKLLILFATAILTFSIPTYAVNMIAKMGIAEQVEEQAPTISIEKNIITVQGGSGMILEVVSPFSDAPQAPSSVLAVPDVT